MKPVVSLFVVSFEGEHPLYVVEHIVKDTRSETSLKLPLVSAVGLFVEPGVFVKVPAVPCVSILTIDVEVLENVIKVEAERLGTRSGSAFCLPKKVCRVVPTLVILSSSGFV